MVTLEIHLTDKCNLKCLHCNGNSSPEKNVHLPLAAAQKAVDGLVALDGVLSRPSTVSPGGGEPFLYSDFYSILAYASDKADNTIILTNGTLLDDRACARVMEYPNAVVQLSIDGLESSHDFVRGKGTFRRMMRAVETLHANGVKTNCSMTVNRVNIDDAEPVLELCHDYDIKPVLHRYVPNERGDGLLRLSYEDSMNLYRCILRNREKYGLAMHCICGSLVSMIGPSVPFYNECNIGIHCIIVGRQGRRAGLSAPPAAAGQH